MTEEEQATLAYIKLQDDVKELITKAISTEVGQKKSYLHNYIEGVVQKIVVNQIGKTIQEELDKYKQEMIMEICIAVGRTIQVADREGRAPLWETDPTEFGLTKEQLNSHMLGDKDAIR